MNQKQENSSKSFKKHINGLRGIAILAILLFHLYPPICPLGFRGVDLFLIISGFFLLPHLLDGMEKESWSIRRFYVNKCRRILTPTIPLLIIVSIVAFIIYPPSCYLKRYRLLFFRAYLCRISIWIHRADILKSPPPRILCCISGMWG